MDWRGRKYYCVSFYWNVIDMRIENLQRIGKVKIRSYQDVPKQPDEIEERGHYQFMLGVPMECVEAVEYELRKAERNDLYCNWKEIKRDTSKKYFDIFGFEMPYRKCDLNPMKRCNHCMNC